jgi:hypothetical protein
VCQYENWHISSSFRTGSRLGLEHYLDEIHHCPSHYTVRQELKGCRSHFYLDEVERSEVVWSSVSFLQKFGVVFFTFSNQFFIRILCITFVKVVITKLSHCLKIHVIQHLLNELILEFRTIHLNSGGRFDSGE